MSDRDFISLTTPRQGVAHSLTESMASGSSKEENKKNRQKLIQTVLSWYEKNVCVCLLWLF